MLSDEYRSAAREWIAEVDSVATELILKGYPPWNAAEQAREIVSARRRRAAKSREQQQKGAGA